MLKTKDRILKVARGEERPLWATTRQLISQQQKNSRQWNGNFKGLKEIYWPRIPYPALIYKNGREITFSDKRWEISTGVTLKGT